MMAAQSNTFLLGEYRLEDITSELDKVVASPTYWIRRNHLETQMEEFFEVDTTRSGCELNVAI